MAKLVRLFLWVVLGTAMLNSPAWAADKAGLFVNLSSDEPHRAEMALTFAQRQLKNGHPVVIFLNLEGTRLAAAKATPRAGSKAPGMLKAFIADGGKVIACQHCMEQLGMKDGDLLQGIRKGNPDVTGAALFDDSTRSISW